MALRSLFVVLTVSVFLFGSASVFLTDGSDAAADVPSSYSYKVLDSDLAVDVWVGDTLTLIYDTKGSGSFREYSHFDTSGVPGWLSGDVYSLSGTATVPGDYSVGFTHYKVNGGMTTPTVHHVLVCVHSPPANVFTLKFDANGGGAGAPRILSCIDRVLTHVFTVPAGSPAAPDADHIFLGWSVTSDGVRQYSQGSTVQTTANTPMTLYAVWGEKGSGSMLYTYNLYFDVQGGSPEVQSIVNYSYDTEIEVVLPATAPVSDRHMAFKCWATERDGSGDVYGPGETINMKVADSVVCDVTLYAQYDVYFIPTVWDDLGELLGNSYVWLFLLVSLGGAAVIFRRPARRRYY